MNTITMINTNITNTIIINQPINTIHAEANKPAELLENKQADQDKQIL